MLCKLHRSSLIEQFWKRKSLCSGGAFSFSRKSFILGLFYYFCLEDNKVYCTSIKKKAKTPPQNPQNAAHPSQEDY